MNNADYQKRTRSLGGDVEDFDIPEEEESVVSVPQSGPPVQDQPPSQANSISVERPRAGSTSGARKPKPRGYSVAIDILRINLLQLQNIEMVSQTFGARFMFHLRIQDGANDPDLTRDLHDTEPVFPKDTLRPGARWFMEQIEFPTSLNHTIISRKVVQMGAHLDIVIKMSGTFFVAMELHNFPLDVQQLAATFSITCAEEGIVPVHYSPESLRTAAVAVDLETFSMSNMWQLFPTMAIAAKTVVPMPG
eukprot:320582-Prymnesium_polylepis.1